MSTESKTHHAKSAAAGTNAHKVLAERYKTKMCKNFMEKGTCPYETRCMFAHGEEDLRSTEMNIRDGLVTEDAIKHFKRIQAFKTHATQAKQQALASSHSDRHHGHHSHQPAPPAYDEAYTSYNERRGGDVACSREEEYQCERHGSYAQCHREESWNREDSYHHDPYGWVPYSQDYQSEYDYDRSPYVSQRGSFYQSQHSHSWPAEAFEQNQDSISPDSEGEYRQEEEPSAEGYSAGQDASYAHPHYARYSSEEYSYDAYDQYEEPTSGPYRSAPYRQVAPMP